MADTAVPFCIHSPLLCRQRLITAKIAYDLQISVEQHSVILVHSGLSSVTEFFSVLILSSMVIPPKMICLALQNRLYTV